MAKTFTEIVRDMQIYIKSVFPTVLTGGGASSTIFNDVIIAGPSRLGQQMNGQIDYVYLTSSYNTFLLCFTSTDIRTLLKSTFGFTTDQQLDAKLTTDLDKKALDDKQFRNFGTAASTTMIFVFGSTDFVSIPAGMAVKTAGLIPTSYLVTDTIALNPVQQSTGVFTLPVPVTCDIVGILGNTSSGTILDFSGGVTGLQSVNNPTDVVNGFDPEDNVTFCSRLIQIQYQGFAFDTRYGLTQFFLSKGVPDVAIITAQDANSTRAFAVDAWIMMNTPLVGVDQIIWDPSYSTAGYKPLFQPVEIQTTGFSLSNFAAAEFLTIKESEIQDFAASKQSSDRIVITFPSGSVPEAGDQLTLTYVYNGAPTLVQTYIEDPNFQLFAEVIVKEAQLRPIQITLPFNLVSGYNPAQVTQQVTATINNQVSALKLGTSYSQSDLIAAVAQVPGVLRILVDEMVFNFVDFPVTDANGNPLPSVDVLPVQFNQYIRVGSGNLIVSVVS